MKQRIAVSALSLSAGALIALAVDEGYTGKAIIPTKGDVPTIGFGTTQGVKMGDTTTPVAALQRMGRDITVFEGALRRCVKSPLYQIEYDTYLNHSYNIGSTGFCSSSIVRELNNQNYVKACGHIKDWRYITLPNKIKYDCSTPGNKICWGLWERRLKDYNTCMSVQ